MGRRGGGRDFDKIVHYYEPYINSKRHKVGVKVRTDGKDVTFYTDHFKQEDGRRPVKNSFKKIQDLYNWIDDQIGEQVEITDWVRKIYITVEGAAIGDLEGPNYANGEQLMTAKIKILARSFEVGSTPDGQRYRRAVGKPKTLEKFDKNIGYGTEKDGWDWIPVEEQEDKPYSRALIDDTPRNRELLVTFAGRFDQLRDQFFRAFGPDHVEKFLSAAAGTMLLRAAIDAEEPGDLSQ